MYIILKTFFKFRSLSKIQSVLLTHGDHVVKVADTFKVIATSNNMIAAIGNDSKKMYGLQFHPEVCNLFKYVF